VEIENSSLQTKQINRNPPVFNFIYNSFENKLIFRIDIPNLHGSFSFNCRLFHQLFFHLRLILAL
jgi:hypothetical protein